MSTRRGDSGRKRGQRHQNSWAYKPGLHVTGKQRPPSDSFLQQAGLCPRCSQIIEWKLKFDKYKPLSSLRKCTVCGFQKVRLAYHHVCGDCGSEKGLCGKCGKQTAAPVATEQSTVTEEPAHEQLSSPEETPG